MCVLSQAASLHLPFFRLLPKTRLPPTVDLRFMKPCLRFLLKIDGWYVRFGAIKMGQSTSKSRPGASTSSTGTGSQKAGPQAKVGCTAISCSCSSCCAGDQVRESRSTDGWIIPCTSIGSDPVTAKGYFDAFWWVGGTKVLAGGARRTLCIEVTIEAPGRAPATPRVAAWCPHSLAPPASTRSRPAIPMWTDRPLFSFRSMPPPARRPTPALEGEVGTGSHGKLWEKAE